MVRICIFNYQPIMLRLGDHVLLSYYETHLLFCFLYYYFQYVWHLSSYSLFMVSSTRSFVVVVTELSIRNRCQPGQPQTQVFSLFVKKNKTKQTGNFYLFHFLSTRHGMEEEAGSKGSSSSHKRCNNFRWPTRKTRKRKISVIFLGC